MDLSSDLRYAVRQVRSSPGVTLIAVVALTLGIGLTTTIFSVVYGFMLRALPFDEPRQIVHLDRTHLARGIKQMPVTIHDFHDWRVAQHAFSDLAAFYYGTVNLSGTERPERYPGAFVTANTFDLLRVTPLLGRGFRAGEDRPGAEPVAVIGYDVWREWLASDPAIVGKTIRANGEVVTVVGVMPKRFAFPYVQQVWLPLRLDPLAIPRGKGQGLEVVGRLKPGVSIDEANAQMNAIARRLEIEHPETNEGIGVVTQTFIESVAGEGPALLYTMVGAVFLVLLVACANVANLLLSRAAGRSREVGIRTAMGAGRGRIVAQFLSEALVLASIGGLLGTGVAFAGVRLFNDSLRSFDGLPYWISIKLDGAALLFVLVTTLVATLAAGVLPALQAARADVGEVLKEQARASSSFRIGRTSRAIVVLEIALSCGLLVAAGLMIRSVTNLRTVDYGFDTKNVFTARVGLPDAKYPDGGSQLRFYQELQTRLLALPGVGAASLGSSIPVTTDPPVKRDAVAVEGRSYARESDYLLTGSLVVAPGYFATFGVGPRQGRDFTPGDREGTLPVALVNESFARRFFAGRSPVGERIRLGGARSTEPWRTIVGVVPDMYVSGAGNKNPDGIYVPMAQSPQRFLNVVLRTGGDPLALTPTVREVVSSMDADLPIYHVYSVAGGIHQETWFYRLFGAVFMVFGFVALFLASVGLYGVMAFSVKRRTREVGIRIALGAQIRDVLRLVLGQGVRQIALGLGLGLSLAALVSQFLVLALFQVSPRDPIVFGGVILTLFLSGIAACLVPALRAARVDAMVAIRSE